MRNEELYRQARRGIGESCVAYVDRCRMYLKRAGEDPHIEHVASTLKGKVIESLNAVDSKILYAARGKSLDEFVKEADLLIGTQTNNVIGAVGERMGNGNQDGSGPICWRCQKAGHLKRNCPERGMGRTGNYNQGNFSNQMGQGNQVGQGNYVGQGFQTGGNWGGNPGMNHFGWGNLSNGNIPFPPPASNIAGPSITTAPPVVPPPEETGNSILSQPLNSQTPL